MTVLTEWVVGAAGYVVEAVAPPACIDVSAGRIIGSREFAGFLADDDRSLTETHVRPRGLSDANCPHDYAPDAEPVWLASVGLG